VSQFLIVQRKSEIYLENEKSNSDDFSSNKIGIIYAFTILNIDYEYLDFLFNDSLTISDLSTENKETRIEIIYNGRNEFNNNSYRTADIIVHKIISFIENDKNIDELFNYLKKNCYPNMGGYAAVENSFLIGNLYFEKNNYEYSIKYFSEMKTVKSISEITISEFYKEAATLFFDKGHKSEALKMIDYGLELNPKLSVKKMKKSLDNQFN